MDWWTGGLVDWWTGGLVDWWTGRLVDCWTGGLVAVCFSLVIGGDYEARRFGERGMTKRSS